MVKVTTDGGKAALDLRLVLPPVREHLDSKINQAVEKIHQVWLGSAPQKRRAVRLLRHSTPPTDQRSFSVCDDVPEKPIARGIPDSEDITKNQASARVDEGTEQNAEVVQEKPDAPGQKRNGTVGTVRP
jgi:hypothetical protein